VDACTITACSEPDRTVDHIDVVVLNVATSQLDQWFVLLFHHWVNICELIDSASGEYICSLLAVSFPQLQQALAAKLISM